MTFLVKPALGICMILGNLLFISNQPAEHTDSFPDSGYWIPLNQYKSIICGTYSADTVHNENKTGIINSSKMVSLDEFDDSFSNDHTLESFGISPKKVQKASSVSSVSKIKTDPKIAFRTAIQGGRPAYLYDYAEVGPFDVDDDGPFHVDVDFSQDRIQFMYYWKDGSNCSVEYRISDLADASEQENQDFMNS